MKRETNKVKRPCVETRNTLQCVICDKISILLCNFANRDKVKDHTSKTYFKWVLLSFIGYNKATILDKQCKS